MWKRDNLRKNLLRVKQFADQNLGRSEKSEVLSEDLQSVERRVETVKQICQTTTKKLASNIQSNDKDRRQKKTPEIGLASSLQESATSLGTDTIMGNLFLLCSECEAVNGKEQVLYDVEVENNVIAPLLAILDEEIPTITKLKKNLSRLTLDMDSAKNRWNTAVKQSQLHGTMAQAALKADQIKTEYEDASTKVENGKDMLAVELLNFVARESSHSQCLISYLEAKSQYYKNSLEAINQVLPKMHALIKSNPNKPVYGVAISEHLRVTERDIALPIEACVCTLLDAGLEEEGLFRIGGMASHVKKLASAFDAGIVNMEEFQYDIHAVAGSLKQYLRDLPEPLLTFDLYQDFVNSASLHGDQRLTELWNATSRLPKENYENLRYLIKFMSRVCEKSAVNKMTPSNIAIVLGPNLMWSPNAAPNMTSHGVDIIVAELLVTHSDYFFPGEVDFYKTSVCHDAKQRVTVKRSSSGSDTDTRYVRSVSHSGSVVKRSDSALTSSHRSDGSVDPDDTRVKHPASTPLVAVRRAETICTGIRRPSEPAPLVKRVDTTADAADNSRVTRSVSNGESAASLVEITEELSEVRDDGTPGEHMPRARPRAKHIKTNSIGDCGTDTNADLTPHDGGGGVSPHPRPEYSPPLPPSKEFHSDVYNTAFALQSLGNGSSFEFMNKVRAIWDDQHYQNVAVTKNGVAATTEIIESEMDGG